ncbi:uncharacterized protein KGF55_000364 [Candida pseudojiufengensis]|uniref:uncharacterized protein n=1 Tax=Candida pseudojiufengensis TaxID=497109 RepID=UPI002224E57A|nr:uncharacterized protein KGF55_000364 [Candida pseudojiufengensis]KAI5966955.1 hypothetical protein KGF55_000364 [Candida pseudojiufengensis]
MNEQVIAPEVTSEMSKNEKIDLAYKFYRSDLKKEKNKRTPINTIAKIYDVSSNGLRYRITKGESKVNGNLKRRTVFPVEEEVIVSHSIKYAQTGVPLNEDIIVDLANAIIKNRGSTNYINKQWMKNFKKRNESLIKFSELTKMSDIRYRLGGDFDNLDDFYDKFKEQVIDKEIPADKIFTFDESYTILSENTIRYGFNTFDGEEKPLLGNENSEYVTVVECCSMSGKAIKPMIIFKGDEFDTNWFDANKYNSYEYEVSPTGWTSHAKILHWLRHIFIPESGAGKNHDKVVLLMDNHESHYTLEFMEECYENNIFPIYTPSYSSHHTHPLVRGVFKLMRKIYRQKCVWSTIKQEVSEQKIEKNEFLQFYTEAREIALSPTQIMKSWKRAGLEPFNPNRVLLGKNVYHKPAIDDEEIDKTIYNSEEEDDDGTIVPTGMKVEELLERFDVKEDALSELIKNLFNSLVKGETCYKDLKLKR